MTLRPHALAPKDQAPSCEGVDPAAQLPLDTGPSLAALLGALRATGLSANQAYDELKRQIPPWDLVAMAMAEPEANRAQREFILFDRCGLDEILELVRDGERLRDRGSAAWTPTLGQALEDAAGAVIRQIDEAAAAGGLAPAQLLSQWLPPQNTEFHIGPKRPSVRGEWGRTILFRHAPYLAADPLAAMIDLKGDLRIDPASCPQGNAALPDQLLLHHDLIIEGVPVTFAGDLQALNLSIQGVPVTFQGEVNLGFQATLTDCPNPLDLAPLSEPISLQLENCTIDRWPAMVGPAPAEGTAKPSEPKGALRVLNCQGNLVLPERIAVRTLALEGEGPLRFPADTLVLEDLKVTRNDTLEGLPDGFSCKTVIFKDCAGLRALPDGLKAETVKIINCPNLTTLGSGIQTGHLTIEACPGLVAIGPGLNVVNGATFRGCPNLKVFGAPETIRFLALHGCDALPTLPEIPGSHTLELVDCAAFRSVAPKQATHSLRIQDCPAWNLTVPVGIQQIGHPSQRVPITGQEWRALHRKPSGAATRKGGRT
jgi:hypothetical protein